MQEPVARRVAGYALCFLGAQVQAGLLSGPLGEAPSAMAVLVVVLYATAIYAVERWA